MSSVCPAKFVRRGNYDDRCLASGKFAFLSCKKSEQPPVPRNVQSCRLECIIRFASCTNYTSVRYLRGETLASSPIFLHRIYSQSQYLSPRPSSSNTSDRIATRRGTIYYFGASDVGHLTVVVVVVVFRTFPPFQWPVYVWCAEPRTYLNDDTRRSNEIPENPRPRGKK